MEKITSLNLDFDRVLVQLIVPGVTAVFPWIILFVNHHASYNKFIIGNLSVFVTAIVLIGLIVGIILENAGSRIEVSLYDKRNAKLDMDYRKVWEEYLQLNYGGNEPIGHRYIRNILLRMKFELSFGCAMVPMSIGLGIFDYQFEIFQNNILDYLFIYIIPFILFIYLIFKEGYSSSKVLANTRKLLVEKYRFNS